MIMWIMVFIVILILSNWVTYQLTKFYWRDELKAQIEHTEKIVKMHDKLFDNIMN